MSEGSKVDAARRGLDRCERLLSNPDVQWLIEEAIGKVRAEKDKELRALTTPKDAREIAAHVLEALQGAESFLARQRDIYARQIPGDKTA